MCKIGSRFLGGEENNPTLVSGQLATHCLLLNATTAPRLVRIKVRAQVGVFSGNIAGEKKKDLQRHDMSPRTSPHFVSSSLTTTLATKRRPERHANHGYRKVKPRRESMTGGPHLAILPGRAKNGMPVVHTVVLFPPVPFRFFISQEGQLLHFFFWCGNVTPG